MPAKNQGPAVPAISLARQSLKEALEARHRAEALADKAAMVVQAASTAVERARAEASGSSDLDDDVVKSRLAALKGEPGAKTPEEIREARYKRIVAKEELLAAEDTLKVAERELGAARGNIERIRKMCASHITSVLSETVTDVIAAWARANEERERLRTTLLGLIPVIGLPLDLMPAEQRANVIRDSVIAGGLPFGDLSDWEHVQRKVGEALGSRFDRQDPGPGIARAKSYWKHFADAVLADPAAEPDPLPSDADLWGH